MEPGYECEKRFDRRRRIQACWKITFQFFKFYLSLYGLLLYIIKSYTMTDQSLTRIDRVTIKKEYRENFKENEIRENIMKVVGINGSPRLVTFQ